MWNFTLISKVKISREVTMIASKFGIGQQVR
ncbi:heat-shock protein HspQ, partial [Escherichia coli]|nr:heat-shock protein HspQ [Escherichia coli]